MYLALIPDDKSTEAIRRAVPAAGFISSIKGTCGGREKHGPKYFADRGCASCGAHPTKTYEGLHLTVIHSTAKIALPDNLEFRAYQAHTAQHGIHATVRGTIRVGPTGRRQWALGLALPIGVREYAQRELRTAGVNWSSQWPLNPHITLCSAPVLALADELPTTVVFNRLEWRA